MFTVYPAIDLRNGKVVRLREGDPSRQTIYGNSPILFAEKWKSEGARWLHVVNLDGAFEEEDSENQKALQALTKTNLYIQFGGGIRSFDSIAQILDMGITRVILGTLALENPRIVEKAIARFGAEKIIAGIDARNNLVHVRGWKTASTLSPTSLGKRLASLGIETVILTNIARDGMGLGVDVSAAQQFSEATHLAVIVSGGARSIEDVCQSRAAHLEGIVIGRALYDGKIPLREAFAC